MKDRFGREIDYLRISVTRRCNFRCAYCGAGEAGGEELSPAQFAAAAAAFRRAGIRKIRLTGGEPLIRGDIDEIAARVNAAAAPDYLAITTNGVLLKEKAAALKAAGVRGVNLSLDTLDGDCFRQLTGADALPAVLAGLETALSLGFDKVKINAVLLRGVNDDGAEKLVELAREYPLDVRFIELMPAEGGEQRNLMIPADELLRRFPFLKPVPGGDGTAAHYSAPGFRGRIGMISPVTKKFCNGCNRVRLLSDGRVKPCLGQAETYDLRPYLEDAEQLYRAVAAAIEQKPAGHHFERGARLAPMNTIGG